MSGPEVQFDLSVTFRASSVWVGMSIRWNGATYVFFLLLFFFFKSYLYYTTFKLQIHFFVNSISNEKLTFLLLVLICLLLVPLIYTSFGMSNCASGNILATFPVLSVVTKCVSICLLWINNDLTTHPIPVMENIVSSSINDTPVSHNVNSNLFFSAMKTECILSHTSNL